LQWSNIGLLHSRVHAQSSSRLDHPELQYGGPSMRYD
jgi:hypothetical protein